MCLRHYIELIENHQPQKTKMSFDTNAPFIQNSNQMTSRLTAIISFPRVFFQLLQYSRQRPIFLAQRAALMTKTDFPFSPFSLRFVDSQFNSILSLLVFIPRGVTCTRVTFDIGIIFLDQSQFFATFNNNEIASFWIGNCVKCFFFRVRQSGQRLSFALCWKILK